MKINAARINLTKKDLQGDGPLNGFVYIPLTESDLSQLKETISILLKNNLNHQTTETWRNLSLFNQRVNLVKMCLDSNINISILAE